MNKSLEALLRGYVLFRVNGRYFLRYGPAQKARTETAGEVVLDGWHILKGWRRFFWRAAPVMLADYLADTSAEL